MIKQRQIAAAVLCGAALLGHAARGDAYDPPAGYYDSATGTGATLKGQLNNIIDSVDDPGISDILHTPISYDALRTALQVTDADPNSPGHMLLVYNRVSLNVTAINPGGPISGWDNGVTWNREHSWPQSRGLDSTGSPDGSDLHHLRPSTTSVNTDRENLNFGGAYGAQAFGEVIDDGNTMWYPGNADAGMIARHQFYMAVRYDGTQSGTTNLELGTGDVTDVSGGTDPPPQLGDLNRLIEWHFAAPPDIFERGRNQIIFDDYQHNRNPLVDRPEYVWSVFVDQSNDSRITINGTTPNANGGSTRNVDLGRVFTGSAVPAGQSFTLSKAGNDGTYLEVTTAGVATSTIAGRFNAFRTNQIDSKAISVGLNTNTVTAGLRSGTVTVNNLDITTGGCGGVGCGANDANDTFNVSLTVLDHATPSFASGSLVTSLPYNFGTVTTASTAPSFSFDVFNRNATPGFTANMDFDSVMSSGDTSALTTNAAAAAGSLVLAAGMGHTFTAMMSTAMVGAFSATYTLNFSDEHIAGALNKQIALTLTGQVILAGDYNRDGTVDAGDYIVWSKSNGTSTTAFSGADGDGSGAIDGNDLALWQMHFGEVASGSGGTATVPEPAGIVFAVIGLAVVCRFARSRKS